MIPDVQEFMRDLLIGNQFYDEIRLRARTILKRSHDHSEVIPIDVKPGDKILYHPSVRNFDRSVYLDGVEHFIIGEHSLLAVVEEKPSGENLGHQAAAASPIGESRK